MTSKYTLLPEVFIRDRKEACLLFNVTNDDVLLKIQGNYQPLLDILTSGFDEPKLQQVLSCSPEEASSFNQYLTDSSLVVSDLKGNVFAPKTFNFPEIQAEFINFASAFPSSENQHSIYASYCSCACVTNCCSVSDLCTCAIPPCSS